MPTAYPCLFAPTESEQPVVFDAQTLPRRPAKREITFKFDAGEMALTKGLFTLLNIGNDHRRVTLVQHKTSSYITRVDKGGFWTQLRDREESGACSVDISATTFVRDAMRVLGHGPGDIIAFPVAPHKVDASDIGLNPAEYPYPFYRIVTDQKFSK